MYETYWRLNRKPFENAPDPRFYYPSETHQAALLKLRYALENRRGAALLAGPSGSGKTLAAVMLRGALAESFAPWVHLAFPQMTTAELLAYLADQLDGGAAAWGTVDVRTSVRRIERFLAENAEKGLHAVVVLDEAHLIDDRKTFEALRLLLNFEHDGAPDLTLLWVGQPSILPVFDRMPQWEERLALKCLLRPFNGHETAAYVEHRLKAAGADRSIFEPDALTALHEMTHGNARRINRLCDLSLLIGFAEEQTSLRAEHVEAVCRDLVATVE